METKANDTLAILKLYEIRGEPVMREARRWFMSEFSPQSGHDIVQLLLSGERESAFYRMVASHWDISASFVNNGGIDEKLFMESNTEHVVVFAKLQPFLTEVRELIDEPDYLIQLERLMDEVPNLETKLENRRKLLASWNARAAQIATA
jgi:hypothetical protein